METLTPDHVQTALNALHLGITIRFFPHSTATSQLAADAIGCEVGQIAKSLCFMVHDQPILVIASGDQRIDDHRRSASNISIMHLGACRPLHIAAGHTRYTSMHRSNATPRFTQPVAPATRFLVSR
jgi:prolyl-tRNA editing enzyme YbaK/EbsC (Cys-tRNA(Pro) deacylase)